MSEVHQSIKNLFITPREKYKTECNWLLIRSQKEHREIQSVELSDRLNQNIRSKDMSRGEILRYPDISTLLEMHGEKLCANTVNKDYIMSEYERCDYIIILLSLTKQKYDLRKPKDFIERLCGLVFLERVTRDKLYISLICGKPGLGRRLMDLSENFAIGIGCTEMSLSSLDAPIGFYIKNNYLFDKGSSARSNVGYNISNGPEEDDPMPDEDKLPESILEPVLGYIHKEGKDSWVLTKSQDVNPWLYMKPGYISLYQRVEVEDEHTGDITVTYLAKYPSDKIEYLEGHDKTPMTRVFDSNGQKFRMNINGGVITNLSGVVTYKIEKGYDGVPMTKNLLRGRTLVGGSNIKNKKTRKNTSNNKLTKRK